MLFKVTDIKGKDRWINPVYVRMLRGRSGRTEIWVAGDIQPVVVAAALDDVATVVNAAGPSMPPPPADAPGTDPDSVALITILAAS